MFLAYLDEAQGADHYYVTALVVQESVAPAIASALEDVAAYACAEHSLTPGLELHGEEMLNGKAAWKPLKSNYEAQMDVFRRAIAVIAAHEVCIYIRGVHVPGYVRRYGTDVAQMHGAALAWTLERVQSHVARAGDLALAISDERKKEEAIHRQSLRSFQKTSTFGWKAQRLDRIVDTIYFAPSEASRLLQAADLVSYAHIRTKGAYTHPNVTAFNAEMWGMLSGAGKVGEASAWYPYP